MNFISEVKEFSQNPNYSDLNTMINYPIENKSDILNFLKSFAPVAVMAHGIADYIKNIQNNNESLKLFNSDDWFWTNEIIYHFEKYDLKLKNDFVEYVVNKNKETAE